ncbi:hypothetical protein [Celerinatantimonas diazotrophica]|uniref:Lipoprotein n=1 Tax=Celerinatantimonas diazotrophica TaxID=412034 RepID=A0A4R1KI55_9GAMM|nr:hypothetical protein [Celerinatantimonas diazotrophica]TCK63937.1 hypothetical protein EV690_0051 [Celerinatantimonas diazotrophica]CAG9297022.1 hypothetical protein CEDIAZO_02184 [Celerinatantimonas diazotrophica]
MKRFFAGLMVLILCACALMQLASPDPLLWFSATLFVGLICMLCAWGIWYRKLAFIALLASAVGLGWVWQGSIWLFTQFSLWDSVTFFSSHSPFLQMRHALILWIMLIALVGILINLKDNSDATTEPAKVKKPQPSAKENERLEPKI